MMVPKLLLRRAEKLPVQQQCGEVRDTMLKLMEQYYLKELLEMQDSLSLNLYIRLWIPCDMSLQITQMH